MTLLITVFAAVTATVIWYKGEGKDGMHVGILCWMFWGASLMWLVDAVFKYAADPAAFFRPEAAAMLNDFFLGLSVIALALVIWIVIVLIRDSKGVIRNKLFRKS